MTLKQVQTPDQNFQLFQNNVDAALTPLQNDPLIGGVMVQLARTTRTLGTFLTQLTLTTGQDNIIAHGLGRTPNYWIVTRLLPASSGGVNIWEFVSNSLNKQSVTDKYINLLCSANCTISLWVN